MTNALHIHKGRAIEQRFARDIKEFLDLFAPEPLREELQPYVREHSVLGHVLHHPLLVMVPFNETMNRYANKSYAHKLKMLEEAERDRNWKQYVFTHERPYRLQAFSKIAYHMTPTEWWGVVGHIWTDSENIHEFYDEWRIIWRDTRPGREAAMDDDERAILASLPDEIEIFRGVRHRHAVNGLSWTPDRDKALWFARRKVYGGSPFLASGWVKKERVLAYFSRESEIVVFPEDVIRRKVTRLRD